MMKNVLLTIFVTFSFSSKAIVSHPELEKKYFQLLDYLDKSKQAEIFQLENHLTQNSLEILEGHVPATPEKLAMYLAYTGLMYMNNNNGMIEGNIAFSGKREEIYARYELADKFFTKAEELAPYDDRIKGWHLSANFRYQKYRFGKVEEKIMDDIMKWVDQEPVFHLYNALTMNSDYSFGAEREKKLFEVTQYLSGKDSPCNTPTFLRKGIAKKCNTTNKTPFAVPGVMSYMGDVYLKEAMRSENDETKQHYLNQALRLYRTSKILKPIKIKKWDQKQNLNHRIEIIKGLQNGEDIDFKTYSQTESFLNMYSCKSCHQNGVIKDQLSL